MSEESLDQSMDRLEGLIHQADRITGGTRTTTNGSATVQINAGGVAVWIAATACVVMLVALAVAAMFWSVSLSNVNNELQELRQKDDVLQAYINVSLQGEQE